MIKKIQNENHELLSTVKIFHAALVLQKKLGEQFLSYSWKSRFPMFKSLKSTRIQISSVVVNQFQSFSLNRVQKLAPIAIVVGMDF